MKPHIKKDQRFGYWVCSLGNGDLAAYASWTPQDAYLGWTYWWA